METTDTKFKKVDVLPVVKYYMDQLGIYDLFNEFIPQGNCLILTAQVLCIMVVNIICAGNPLYKIEEWLVDYTDGMSEISNIADLFNDDRCGRSLDKLFDSERSSMMTRLAVTAMRVHELFTTAIHNDSTSITFKGQYNTLLPITAFNYFDRELKKNITTMKNSKNSYNEFTKVNRTAAKK